MVSLILRALKSKHPKEDLTSIPLILNKPAQTPYSGPQGKRGKGMGLQVRFLNVRQFSELLPVPRQAFTNQASLQHPEAHVLVHISTSNRTVASHASTKRNM